MRTLPIALIILLLAGCGGESDKDAPSDSGDNTSLTGVLVDSAVEGIGYRTETKNGFTNAKGEFNYASGETIIFFIGDLELPPVAAKAVITPLDIAGTDEIDNQAAVNISILLQSLDMDADPSNGIRIDYEELKTVAEEVDFEQPIDNFSTAIGNLASAAGNSVVTEINAVEHLKGTLKTLDISFSSKSSDSSMNSVSSEAISSSSKSSTIVSSVMPVSSVSNSVVAVSSAVVAVSSKTNSSVASSKASVGVSKSSLAAVSSTANSSVVSSIKSSATSSAKSSVASSVWTQGVNDKGFTLITPSADSKLIYVSNSEGDDANDCLSAESPCKTIAAGHNKMRAGFPDHLYLKRGDVWRDEALTGIKSGRSVQEPAVVSYYGDSGARPKLERNSSFINTGAANGRHLISNVHFIGLEFSVYKLVYGSSEFTGSHDDSASFVLLGSNKNILIEDCVFNHAELVVQDFTTSNTTERHPVNIILRRNIWTGAYADASSLNQTYRPSNLYASSVEGLLIEENVFDHGGWNPNVMNASANMYNHNLYLQTSNVGNLVTVRNNIITRASSHGIHGRAGGLFENNFFARNAISLQMGYANTSSKDENGNTVVKDNSLKQGTFARAISNVITEGHSMVKGTNPCVGSNLCTSALWGLRIENVGQGEITANKNIVHSLSPVDNQWQVKYSKLSLETITQIGLDNGTGNIMWKWKTETEGTDKTYTNPGRTLADYSSYLGKAHDFDAFMQIVLTRPLNTWDEKYTADAINDYIRAGFDME